MIILLIKEMKGKVIIKRMNNEMENTQMKLGTE